MTDQQINWAITEAIGADPHWKCAKDYCNDLNAMHDAEKTLSTGDMYVMEVQLKYVLSAGEFYFHATAHQRAEAFLLTLGKWEESK
jgi:hypothetical protein